MKQSNLFVKSRKEVQSEETSINAQLLLKAGFVDKLMAGVYTYLPLGLRVLDKIKNIVREEMNKAGGQEILMPALTPKEIWVQTNRWENFDALFKLESNNHEYALGATHEEVVTPLLQKFTFSYKDLPQAVYQIQTKFRNEARSKSGLLRGREFSMKDMYSFHTDEEDLNRYYAEMEKVYEKVWERLGIGHITVKTYAAGGAFSKYSHEYQTFAPVGEDLVYYCSKCNVAINKEIIEDLGHACPECHSKDLEERTSIEVGNIFKLMTKFSGACNFNYTAADGSVKPVIMGCYGIGPSRLMGTLAEIYNDANGLIWPKAVAPFQIHLLSLGDRDESVQNEIMSAAQKLYEQLTAAGWEVLWDDRLQASNGEKFKDSDLFGIPLRLVLGKQSLQAQSVEVKLRNQENGESLPISEDLEKKLKEIYNNYAV
ncbi:MAG TPA: His/Gly/Thr/Pro-type tRNA ligase C-terminal domain-containing protein [bacterium]|nr:His/Gly/Thr/Pro-type tRNA ligase C-terminal domain-containing protein [bacterium]